MIDLRQPGEWCDNCIFHLGKCLWTHLNSSACRKAKDDYWRNSHKITISDRTESEVSDEANT